MPPAVNQMPHVIGLGPPLGSGGDIVISPTPEPPTEWVPPTQNPPAGPHVLPEPPTKPEPGSVGPGKQSQGGSLPGMNQPGIDKAKTQGEEGGGNINTPGGRTVIPHGQQRSPGQETPSLEDIDRALDQGKRFPSSRVPGREIYYDPVTNTTVVTEAGGNTVVSARRGKPSGIIE